MPCCNLKNSFKNKQELEEKGFATQNNYVKLYAVIFYRIKDHWDGYIQTAILP